MVKSLLKDKLAVEIYETRDKMGKAAANDIADAIHALFQEKDEINMIFAAAPSQNDVLFHLCERDDIAWEKINAFHMDEYIGLPKAAPQGFANFLIDKIFSKKPFKSVNLIDSTAQDPDAESERYSKLLQQHPTDIVVLGIGENGHIAFNDPHVADFNDAKMVKPVELDETCRQQQVNDGCFASLEQVPKYAMTLTVPTMFAAKYLFCVVPCTTKANAVHNTVEGEISEMCPATILRKHDAAKLYCDSDSAALLEK